MHLLDVNLLFALLSPDHPHHQLARRWWVQREGKSWATCETVQMGFVRLASNKTAIQIPRPPGEAFDMLARNTARPDHHFLEARTDEFLRKTLRRTQGYRQVTDAYLVALALSHGCKFATFDQKLRHLSPDPDAIEIIPLI